MSSSIGGQVLGASTMWGLGYLPNTFGTPFLFSLMLLMRVTALFVVAISGSMVVWRYLHRHQTLSKLRTIFASARYPSRVWLFARVFSSTQK